MRGKPLSQEDQLNIAKKMMKQNKPFTGTEAKGKNIDVGSAHVAGTLLPREKNYGVRV